MNDIFVLKKSTDNCKKGKQFKCYGGIVRGTILTINGEEQKINFDNEKYFRLKRKYNKRFNVGDKIRHKSGIVHNIIDVERDTESDYVRYYINPPFDDGENFIEHESEYSNDCNKIK